MPNSSQQKIKDPFSPLVEKDISNSSISIVKPAKTSEEEERTTGRLTRLPQPRRPLVQAHGSLIFGRVGLLVEGGRTDSELEAVVDRGGGEGRQGRTCGGGGSSSSRDDGNEDTGCSSRVGGDKDNSSSNSNGEGRCCCTDRVHVRRNRRQNRFLRYVIF